MCFCYLLRDKDDKNHQGNITTSGRFCHHKDGLNEKVYIPSYIMVPHAGIMHIVYKNCHVTHHFVWFTHVRCVGFIQQAGWSVALSTVALKTRGYFTVSALVLYSICSPRFDRGTNLRVNQFEQSGLPPQEVEQGMLGVMAERPLLPWATFVLRKKH